ncbi:SpoIIIAH-like family protein [Paenibacillus sp. YYML68]|uniref:SpoIIIAH-like family protein n=1 Tax=Paenibacillus sp. YYML68 TaxID=2909250 RepID=UPI00249157B5|nr:SpoIIIAH-like family protein [Paenibacillus sp. YYML68]
MNSKRQTVWLVSMLSLMVVLSAYYLFTEDVSELEVATAGMKTNEIVVNTGQLDVKPQANAEKTGEVDAAADKEGTAQKPEADKTDAKSEPKADAKAEPQAADSGKEAPKSDAKTETKESSTKTDTPSSAAEDKTAKPVSSKEASEQAQLLQKMQATATAGTDYFINLQLKRNEEWSAQVEKLLTVITDSKQTTDASVKAQQEYDKLIEMETKITSFEESLQKDFAYAVVTQTGSKWKISVQTTKLEKSQAVSILDKAMKELGLSAEQVTIEAKP